MTVTIHLVYYSMYGHIKKLADAYKAGADTVEGVEVKMFRVAETLPQEVLDKMHAPPKAEDPVYDSHTLPEADGFIFGFPTRFGTPAAQFKAMIDSTGQLWAKGALALKPYSLFTSTATQGGGQETTLLGMVNNLTHHGMIFVPGGMACASSLTNMTEIHGGSAWGAGTLAGPDGSRSPSEVELEYAKAAGAQLAKVAKKLAAA